MADSTRADIVNWTSEESLLGLLGLTGSLVTRRVAVPGEARSWGGMVAVNKVLLEKLVGIAVGLLAQLLQNNTVEPLTKFVPATVMGSGRFPPAAPLRGLIAETVGGATGRLKIEEPAPPGDGGFNTD